MSKILIKQDNSCEMLSIYKDGECIFYGNNWDFKRNGKGLESLLIKLGLEVELDESWEYDSE